MEEKKIKGLARLRYNLFLLKPYWKYGKSYVIITFVVATVFQPLSTYLATLLPQKAIDAVMAGTERRGVLVIIGAYTLGIALVAAAGKIIEIGYSEIVRTKIHQKIQKDVNEKALFTDYKYYDNPDFFTKFIFAQDQYPQQALFAMREIPHILKGVVTVAAMGTLIASAGPVLLMVTLFFVVLNALVGLPTLKPHADFIDTTNKH